MKKLISFALCAMVFVCISHAQVTIIPYTDTWKYLDNGTNQGTAWRSASFDDASWKTGSGKFGYGISDANTNISYGPDRKNRYITTYFRKTFSIADPAAYNFYEARMKRDDGAVVYINGTEVYRSNMPAESINYTTLAAIGASDNGSTGQLFNINSSAFVAGTNVIAVEIHQQQTTSDMAFDFNLASAESIPPVVVSIARQSPSSTITNATSVIFRATFSEPVSGVDATDFTITSTGTATAAVSSVTAVSGTIYDISLVSISGIGTLRLDLQSAGTGIVDQVGNAISGGFTHGQIYNIQEIVEEPGFSSITPLSPINLSNPTKDKPQAKAWYYANQWWCVLSAVGGTKIFRLDGTSWTETLTLNTVSSKPDCWASGDLVHLLLYKGASNNSLLYSAKYDPTSNAYKLWTTRPTAARIVFPAGSETATLVVDGNGRMWAATAGNSQVQVWWSDAPYSTWSAPVTIATGVTDDDICSLTAMPGIGKIGVFWSNQNTRKFGFRTHSDGADPSFWSLDEVPGLSTALDNIKGGMADDHMNLKVASDGTVYCAAKTSYDKLGYPKLILLVRRPSGVWDDHYTVTLYPDGTQPLLLLNEAKGKLSVVYTTVENGGDIRYATSSTNVISFGTPITLMSNPGMLYNYAASTHQNYESEIVIIATEQTSTPMRAISLLASDVLSSPLISAKPPSSLKPESSEIIFKDKSEIMLKAYPNPFNSSTNLSFKLKQSGYYTIIMYDNKGIKLYSSEKRWADAAKEYVINLNKASIPSGLYLVSLQTSYNTANIKLLKNK